MSAIVRKKIIPTAHTSLRSLDAYRMANTGSLAIIVKPVIPFGDAAVGGKLTSARANGSSCSCVPSVHFSLHYICLLLTKIVPFQTTFNCRPALGLLRAVLDLMEPLLRKDVPRSMRNHRLSLVGKCTHVDEELRLMVASLREQVRYEYFSRAKLET